jgi:hypothetical protein
MKTRKGKIIKYGYNTGSVHSPIIYEKGSVADKYKGIYCEIDTQGLIVGSTGKAWLTEENGRRICACLEFLSGIDIEIIEDINRLSRSNRKEKHET